MNNTVTLMALLSPLIALADINVRDASFRETWNDLQINLGSALQRTYNSRSLTIGIFGFGWCSPYEKNLTLQKNVGTAILNDCTLDSAVPVRVVRERDLWKVVHRGQNLIFNSTGQLASVENATGYKAKINYHHGEISSIQFSTGGSLQFQLNPRTHFVDQITSHRGDQIRYAFDGQNLIRVSSSRGIFWKFKYDELHNLIEVHQKNSSKGVLGFTLQESISYETGRDRVLRYQGHNKCTDQFTYLPSKKLESTTILQRECPKRTLEVLKYHFQFAENKDGTISLTALSVKSGSGTTALHFNQRTGEQLAPIPAFVGGLK